MQQKTEVILLSIDRWLSGLIYSAAAYSKEGREIFWINPCRADEEIAALEILAGRLPVALVDATGDSVFGDALRNSPELAPLLTDQKGSNLLPAAIKPDLLAERFGPARGLVIASQEDPSRCLKAAVLAVRLGYYFLPLELLFAVPPVLPDRLPLVWLGSESRWDDTAGCSSSEQLSIVPDDLALAALMQRLEPLPDYLLLFNSDDINERPSVSLSMGDYRVRGISLLAPLCASYRRVFPIDVCTAEPDPLAIEEELNNFVAAAGLQPAYQAILASPGSLPFIYDRRLTIGSRSEEAVREIHLRLNDDLFFDLCEGRLFQSTPGGLSLQIISTKHYHRITGTAMADKAEKELLVVTTPHVEGGIIFTSDEPLIECQLKPLLEEEGYRVNILAGEKAHYAEISAALTQADFFLYTGHGGPESLHTHGRFLSRSELPPLPPLVAFASACSTAAVDPHWYSTSDGLDWDCVPVPGSEVIGLAMVEKGAICYVGGMTLEDLQYSTSVYGIFMEALLVRGCSVGEAVRELRNFISLYASLFQQKSPEGYRCYKQGTANAIHQQLLLGDPALVPCPGEAAGRTAFPQEREKDTERCRLRVSIPEGRWRRLKRAVSPLAPSNFYYRSRAIEVLTPFGEGVVSWGDYYRIAPDADGITAKAMMSSYLHLHLDLPPGRYPLQLNLKEVKASGSECLLCGKKREAPSDPTAAFQDFRIPYLLLPPARMNMTSGWAFAVEERGPDQGVRIHWLVPALVIDDATRTAIRAAEFLFEIETAAAQTVKGKVMAPRGDSETDPTGTCLVSAAAAAGEGAKDGCPSTVGSGATPNIVAQALTRPGGRFEITCAAGANLLTVAEQFPLYELAAPYRTFRQERWRLPSSLQNEIRLAPAPLGTVSGKVLDSRSAVPLPGALLRVWRGIEDPVGDPLIEGFAGETYSDAGGSFAFDLPAGKYILSAVARPDGVQYKSKSLNFELAADEEQRLLLPLDAAAVINGRIKYGAEPPPHPVIVVLMRFPEKGGGEIVVSTPAQPGGSFSCLVGFQDRFYVWIEEEGWQMIKDSNEGRGYKVPPGEELRLSYTLLPDEA